MHRVLLFMLLSHFVWSADVVFENTTESKVGFIAFTPMFNVNGNFEKFSIKVVMEKLDATLAKIDASIELASVKTGIARRDKHLRDEDFFMTSQYPNATFVSKSVRKDNKGTFLVDGVLQIRNVKKNVTFPLVMTKIDGEIPRYRFVGQIDVNRREFGIVYDSFAVLPKIEDKVTITIDAVMVEKKK